MLRLTDEELSRVQDLCRVLPQWKRSEFLQELARRMQAQGTSDADLRRRRRRQCVRCSVAATPGSRSRTERAARPNSIQILSVSKAARGFARAFTAGATVAPAGFAA